MKAKLSKYTYLVLAVGIIIVAAIIENGLLRKHPETRLIQEFQTQLIQNEKELQRRLTNFGSQIESDGLETVIEDFYTQKETLVRQTGFGFLVYENSELVFWSDRSIAFYNSPDQFEKASGFVQLPNGYYLVDTLLVGDYQLVGLHLIKNKYTFENKYLQNAFFSHYKIPNDYIIETSRDDDAYVLTDARGDFLFSLWPYGKYLCTTKQLYFPGFLYLLGLVFLLIYFRKEFAENRAPFVLKLLALGGALFVVYWFHLLFLVPKVFFHLKFFGPDFFAINYWLPSLGDYFLLALFFLFWIYNFSIDLRIRELKENSQLPARILVGILLLFAASLFILVHFLIKELIFNSTISFALNKITDISVQSVIGIFSV